MIYLTKVTGRQIGSCREVKNKFMLSKMTVFKIDDRGSEAALSPTILFLV